MGWWSLYFFVKFLLYAGGFIGFHPWWNLLFAVFTALPAPNRRLSVAKQVVAIPAGIVLLYYDSWLPSLDRVRSQGAAVLSEFSSQYLLELAGRFINWDLLGQIAVMFVLYVFLRRVLRLSTFVFVGVLLIIALPTVRIDEETSGTVARASGPAAAGRQEIDPRNMRAEALDAQLQRFYDNERDRLVRFPLASGEPFDIIVLHQCSISWDDLRQVYTTGYAGTDSDPARYRFVRRMNVLFTRFNSAASYSGPAALRLLRGNCGQIPHATLYEPAPAECRVFDNLQKAGFEPHWLMNHNGFFGDFLGDIRNRGGFPAPLELFTNVPVTHRSFDGKPIYDDYGTLSAWWNKRLANPAPRVALFYNTVTLHDGNRRADGKQQLPYAERLRSLTDALNRFVDEIQASGRRVIVVGIPEHGAAVRGDRRQIAGLREIPTPAITLVPSMLMLVNANLPADYRQQRIDIPISYLGVNELLSRFIDDNPFDKPSVQFSSYIQNLPSTDFVAENEGGLIMQLGRYYMLRTPDGEWSPWGREGE
ncbi:MAG TPA: cellulose biosynthesis protein BcsG [Povalibacter sp.]|nr:cellulose biosynthesis protein BcsG [Povalibacter sp.]